MPWLKLLILLLVLSPSWPGPLYAAGSQEPETQYLLELRNHVGALLKAQAAETKMRLVCLDYQHSRELNPTGSKELEELFLAYKESEQCQDFLDQGIQSLFMQYSQMRIHLALYQGRPNEVHQLTSEQSMMGGVRVAPWLCHRLESPLYFFNTNFCFEHFETIASPRPVHILKKSSYGWLDRLWSGSDLPEVADLPPLIWEEALRATEVFHEHYYSGEDHLSQQRLAEWDLANEVSHHSEDMQSYQRDQRLTKARLTHYYRALDFQAPGVYVFSTYPEDSAPARYMEMMTKNPVLAFFEPETQERDLDCDQQALKSGRLANLCRAYKRSLSNSLWSSRTQPTSFVRKRKSVHAALIQAYKKILQVNQDFQKKFAGDYSLDEFNEGADITKNWLGLMAFEKVVHNLNQAQPQTQAVSEQLKQNFQSAELWRLGGMLALGVGVSLPCGFVAGPKALIGCLLATGLTANGMFYVDSLYRHDNMLRAFFATPHNEQDSEHLLSLVEFGQLRGEVQALYMDSLFLWVGIGGIPAVKMAAKSLSTQVRQMTKLRSE